MPGNGQVEGESPEITTEGPTQGQEKKKKNTNYLYFPFFQWFSAEGDFGP